MTEVRRPEQVLADVAQVVFTQAGDPAAALELIRSLLLGEEVHRDPHTTEISTKSRRTPSSLDDWQQRRSSALASRTEVAREAGPMPRERKLLEAYLRDLREMERKGREAGPVDPESARSHFEAHRQRRQQHLGVLNRALEGTGFTASGLLQQAFEVMGERDPLRQEAVSSKLHGEDADLAGLQAASEAAWERDRGGACPDCKYDHEKEGPGASCLRARTDKELLAEMKRRQGSGDVRAFLLTALDLATDFELCETIATRAGWLDHFRAELGKRGEGPSGRAFDSELEVLFFLNCFPPSKSAPVERQRPPGPIAEALNDAFDLLVDLGGSIDEMIAARILGRGQRIAESQSLRSRKFLSETVAKFPWLSSLEPRAYDATPAAKSGRCPERDSGGAQCELEAGHEALGVKHACPEAVERHRAVVAREFERNAQKRAEKPASDTVGVESREQKASEAHWCAQCEWNAGSNESGVPNSCRNPDPGPRSPSS